MNFLQKFIFSTPKETDSHRAVRGAEPEKLSLTRCLIFLVLLLPFSGWIRVPSKSLPQLEKIKQRGELRFVTRYGPSTDYDSDKGSAGLEHDLATLFARHLGVKARFFVGDYGFRIDRMVASGMADVAGGIFANASHDFPLRFGPVYRHVAEQILYGEGHTPPTSLYDLSQKGIVQIAAGSEYAETLQLLGQHVNGLNWRVNYEHDADELSALASLGKVDYTVTDSDRLPFLRHFYPKLQVAFDIGDRHPIAWALSMSEDVSLYVEVQRFFAEIRANNQLEQLTDRYFGHAERFDSELDIALRRDFHKRLPRIKRWFVQAGHRYSLDWRLLAAVAYQESKWVREAVSPEGVRGLMMLTEETARELKVQDRTDPATSIMGAAAYLKQTLSNIPEDIAEPDRTWYALAAYNLGYTHIEEARDLVQRKGGNPDMWIEIKKVLPRLSTLPRQGRTHKGGNQRGLVTVNYVNSVRRYYDLLVWLTEQDGKYQGLGRFNIQDI